MFLIWGCVSEHDPGKVEPCASNPLLQKQQKKGREKPGETEEERRRRQSPPRPRSPRGLRWRAAAWRRPLGLTAGTRKNVTGAFPLWKVLLSSLPAAPFRWVRGARPGGCRSAFPHGWALMRCVRLLAAGFQSLSYYFKAAAPRFRQVWSLGKISQLGFKREDALLYYLSLQIDSCSQTAVASGPADGAVMLF